MKNLSTYYQELIHTLSTEKNQVNRKIHIIGTIRLLLVIGALLMLYGFHQEGWYIIMGIILLFGLPFHRIDDLSQSIILQTEIYRYPIRTFS